MVFDVAVVGGGNAALCAALAARERGASVVVLERAPREWRAGNSKYTRNIRCVHGEDSVMPGTYAEDEFFADLMGVTEDAGLDVALAQTMVRQSRLLPRWMESHGARWQPAMRGTLQLARTNRFFLGGGKALMNTYYTAARRAGIRIAYDSRVAGLDLNGGSCRSAKVETPDGIETVAARAFVIASGGYEANKQWLAEHWGDAVDRFQIRGCRFNDGGPIQLLLDRGAKEIGPRGGFHATAVDARSPEFDAGIVSRVDSVPFGIVVNRDGERFYDEGEDLWPRRYAIWGRLIAEQPGQIAFSIFDDDALGRFIPPLYEPFRAPTAHALADRLGLPADGLAATIAAYNASTPDDPFERYDPATLDGFCTHGGHPPKSNWALPISPPFSALPLRPGITFTYFGLAIDGTCRVVRTAGGTFENVFAAGEAMAGNILRRGYLAGVGMTIGTVFGVTAGREAADFARA